MPAIGPLGMVFITVLIYGSAICGIVWFVRAVRRVSQDIVEIKEMLRLRQTAPVTTQE